MNQASILAAIVGLAGAVIGGFTSFMASWLTARAQLHQKLQTAARGRREKIYNAFIREATRLFADALGHKREDIFELVSLYELVAQMRLLAPDDIISRAEGVLTAIANAYLGPNYTLPELRHHAHAGGLDPLRQFSEACRTELERFDDA